MPHAAVEIEVEPGPPTDDGHDQVTYLLAANPGERARPLARAASGGELSRAMLAARVVLSEAPPTLVFDEVDAGIGGEAGVAVGRLLQTLGTRHQVLCVTHLAQVAAFAGTQVVVEKAVEQGRGSGERTVAHAHRGRRRRARRRAVAHARRASATRPTPAATPPSCSRPPADGPAPARRASRREDGADGPPPPAQAVRRAVRHPGPGARRPPHQGHDPAPAGGRDRGHQPPRPRPRRRRRAHRGGRRRGDQLRAVDLRALPERRPDPGRAGRASRSSTTSAPSSWTACDEGDVVRIEDGEIWRNGELLGRGTVLDEAGIEVAMEAARAAIGTELERFAANTLEYIQKEARLTFEPLTLPPLHTKFAGRHALVVVRGHDYRSDLAALRSVHPRVPTGAHRRRRRRRRAARARAASPTSSSATSTRCRRRAWRAAPSSCTTCIPTAAPRVARTCSSGASTTTEFVAEGTSEDVAMLLAYESKAQLIVAVGTHATMVEFLDKGRPGMASTFLTRLRLGPMLVDAKGVSRLYEGRVRRLDIFLLVGAALIAMLVVASSPNPSTCSRAASGSP